MEVNGNGHNEAQYGYTDNGRRAWIKDANNNTTSYTYDGYDRLVRTTYPNGTYEQLTLDDGDRIQSVRVRDSRTITYGYDDLDRITARSVPGGSTDTSTPMTWPTGSSMPPPVAWARSTRFMTPPAG